MIVYIKYKIGNAVIVEVIEASRIVSEAVIRIFQKSTGAEVVTVQPRDVIELVVNPTAEIALKEQV